MCKPGIESARCAGTPKEPMNSHKDLAKLMSIKSSVRHLTLLLHKVGGRYHAPYGSVCQPGTGSTLGGKPTIAEHYLASPPI